MILGSIFLLYHYYRVEVPPKPELRVYLAGIAAQIPEVSWERSACTVGDSELQIFRRLC